MELPQNLRTAIDNELASLPSKRLSTLSSELSMRYRTISPSPGRTSSSKEKFLKSQEDIVAYVAFRLPATFAAVYSALMQVQKQIPSWCPQTLLDVGAGPGTAMWAATTLYPELKHITLLEREEGMIELGKRMANNSLTPSIQKADWIKVDITRDWEVCPHDLVIASYSLGELSQDSGLNLIRKLWAITSGTLIIIEPGTPAGFLRIKKARELLLTAGAKTVAPCPHDNPCPISDKDWCHFSQRVARSHIHRLVKSGELSYEDEKFSFLSMSHAPGVAITGRVIRHPQVRTGHICFKLCTPNGLTSTTVSKKDKELYRKSRDLSWGSVMPSI
ncbi:MAG TPA: small ribosomal subunit Rsm22 family protein [Clostridiaceae bacterium]